MTLKQPIMLDIPGRGKHYYGVGEELPESRFRYLTPEQREALGIGEASEPSRKSTRKRSPKRKQP